MSKFITRRGYIVKKNALSDDDVKKIKGDLTFTPEVLGNTQKIRAYTETLNTFILPRFYGEQLLGTAINKLQSQPIDIAFNGKLREKQTHIVNQCLNHIKENGGGLLSVPCGAGKCLAKGTLVMMYDGSLKPVEQITVNQLIMGDDSLPRSILSLATGRENMYAIIDKATGEKYTVNQSHILSLMCVSSEPVIVNNRFYYDRDILDISVDEYLQLPACIRRHFHGYRNQIQFTNNPVPIDSYRYGCVLGSFKRIPMIYKCTTKHNRFQLIHGLVNTCDKSENSDEWYKLRVRDSLARDIVFVGRSIGLECYAKNGVVKIKKVPPQSHTTYEISVKYIGVDQYYGFEIDGNRRFVLGDLSVTHNTVMALKMACDLQVKTLVLVHKTFLMDQWKARAHEFTNARLGIIQQSKVQVDDCDIVIGMIQSIAMREYEPQVFSGFGFVIIDEAHHAPSRVFSKIFSKCCSQYTLALSATPERADGLTPILHHHVGSIAYSEGVKTNECVIVKMFHYQIDHPLFNEVTMKVGNDIIPSMPIMVNNLCAIDDRNTHLLKIIQTVMKDNDRKILILSGRRAHLEEMKNYIDQHTTRPTAYYVGSMTQSDRQSAELHADVLFATYDMAHEGLDIERLNTVILTTPKKNVVQAIGRIMRKVFVNGDTRPLIIDWADHMSIFQKHMRDRLELYLSGLYQVSHYDIDDDIDYDECLKTDGYIDHDKFLQDESSQYAEFIF